jgi:hypothetical protein
MRRLPLLLLLASAVYVTVWIWVASPTDVSLAAHMDLGHCVMGRPEVWCPPVAMCPVGHQVAASMPVSPRDIIEWAVAKGSVGQVNVTVTRYLMGVDANGCWQGYITYVSICMPKPVWVNVVINADQVWLNGTVEPFSAVLTQPNYVADKVVCFNYYLQPTAAVPLGQGDYIYGVPYTFDNITIVVEGRWFPVKTPS